MGSLRPLKGLDISAPKCYREPQLRTRRDTLLWAFTLDGTNPVKGVQPMGLLQLSRRHRPKSDE